MNCLRNNSSLDSSYFHGGLQYRTGLALVAPVMGANIPRQRDFLCPLQLRTGRTSYKALNKCKEFVVSSWSVRLVSSVGRDQEQRWLSGNREINVTDWMTLTDAIGYDSWWCDDGIVCPVRTTLPGIGEIMRWIPTDLHDKRCSVSQWAKHRSAGGRGLFAE